jgi:hypothetical protein
MKSLLIPVIAAALFSVPAQAEKLSKKQEGILYGIGGTILVQQIFKARSPSSSSSSRYPTYGYPVDPVQEAYERGIREREREEQRQREQRAYECGRYGRNCDRI